jgi:hypothetical protein
MQRLNGLLGGLLGKEYGGIVYLYLEQLRGCIYIMAALL